VVGSRWCTYLIDVSKPMETFWRDDSLFSDRIPPMVSKMSDDPHDDLVTFLTVPVKSV
jgi:hypothetical protein